MKVTTNVQPPQAPRRRALPSAAEAGPQDGFSPSFKTLGLAGAGLLAMPAMAAAAPTSGVAEMASSALPGSVLWVAGGAAALGFLLGSVPKDDGWGFDGTKALAWGASAGLVAGGLGAALHGAVGLGLAGAAVGAGVAGLHYLSQERPTVSSVKLESGVNTLPGETEKQRFKNAEKAYNKASFERGGQYATRGRIEWTYGDKGADSEFVSVLRDACQHPSSDTFDILVMLTRNLPAAQEEPAVVVVRGGEQLRSLEFGPSAIKLADGTEVPYASVRAGVGYAWR